MLGTLPCDKRVACLCVCAQIRPQTIQPPSDPVHALLGRRALTAISETTPGCLDQMYEEGEAAVLANIGPMVEPLEDKVRVQVGA